MRSIYLCQLFIAFALASCTDPHSTSPASADVTTSASQPVNPTTSPNLQAIDGAHELSALMIFALRSSPAASDTLAGGRDYNDFKAFASSIKSITPKEVPSGENVSMRSMHDAKLYRGITELLVDGRRLLAENIENDYKWGVYATGPNVQASVLTITSSRVVDPSLSAEAEYFRKAGLRLVPLVCYSLGAMNYEALYLAMFPGKAPAFLTISASAGSRGLSLSYTLNYGSMDWEDVALGQGPPKIGKAPDFGECQVSDSSPSSTAVPQRDATR